jgi:ankyrin repeat protein
MKMKNKNVGEKKEVTAKPVSRKAFESAKPEPETLDKRLLSAVCRGRLEEAKSLIENGAKDSRDRFFKMNAVKVAAKNQKLEILKFLVEAGFEVDVPDYAGRTALMSVCKWTYALESVKLLLKHGADVNKKCNEGSTPLTSAVAFNRVEIVETLLEAGADPDVTEPILGGSLISYARKRGYNEIRLQLERALWERSMRSKD